jgi:ABC-2 type transport system ATP-binding protein
MEGAATESVISVDGLRKTYGSTVAVDHVSFAVERGEIFGLLGSNGAGKTTTVECLEGLRRPDAGSVRLLGLDPVSGRDQLRGRVGCQLQESSLPDRMRVWEALDLFAAASREAADWEPLLAAWGLAEKRNAPFASLSGGQRQRLLVALALVTDPAVVFLDEMTTGLDPAARHASWSLIDAIRERGATVVLVTHFMDEAERLCDRIAVMDAGRIVALGTPSRLIEKNTGTARVRFTVGQTGEGAGPDDDLAWLEAVPHVRSVGRRGAAVEVVGDGPVLTHVAATLLDRGYEPSDLRVERPTLEETFLKLTGHALE